MDFVVILLLLFSLNKMATAKYIKRISGGHEADIRNHPYQVSLRKNDNHICGGSIINKNTIITAAHCFEKNPFPERYTIRVGSNEHSKGTIYKIAKIFTHLNYNSNNHDNDVAILKLAKPLIFTNKVQPIKLQPASRPVPEGTTATVSGWGFTEETIFPIPHPGHLRAAEVDVISNAACRQMYYPLYVSSTMLCAYTPGKDACQHDSGGPLVADGRLIGVVSWGYGCARENSPGVYAKVSVLRGFIDSYL